jgi:hypothetical protein
VYHTTGLYRDEIVDLCALIHSADTGPEDKTWPPSVGLFNSVVLTLTYLRRNRAQQELAETYGTSQPTVSRAISSITRLIKEVLTPYVPTAGDLEERCQYLVDGTLLPCWSWAAHPELYSGKHKTTGMNVQVACTLAEKLAWISDPIDGSRHDSYCLNESGVLLTLDPADWTGDKGYVGNGMITPIRKPECRDLLGWAFRASLSSGPWRHQCVTRWRRWRQQAATQCQVTDRIPATGRSTAACRTGIQISARCMSQTEVVSQTNIRSSRKMTQPSL